MTDSSTLSEVLRDRSAFYRMLSNLYFTSLTQEQIDSLAEHDLVSFAGGDELLAAGFDDMRRYLRKRNTGTRQDLAVDFTSAFVGAQQYEGRCAVPYESVFRSESGLLMQEPRNEVYRLYKRAAVKLKEGVDLPEDHLSFEFEFLALLSDRTIDALREDRLGDAVDLLGSQKVFIEEHILSWFNDLAELALKILTTRFYRGVLKITEGYLTGDIEVIDALIAEIRSVAAGQVSELAYDKVQPVGVG
jgi:putative dimethyl sulfoxide reductase chaperone